MLTISAEGLFLENIALRNRVKELEASCTNFIEVEINLQDKIKQLYKEIEILQKMK